MMKTPDRSPGFELRAHAHGREATNTSAALRVVAARETRDITEVAVTDPHQR